LKTSQKKVSIFTGKKKKKGKKIREEGSERRWKSPNTIKGGGPASNRYKEK